MKCCCLLGFADLLASYLRCRFVRFQVGLQAFHDEAVCHIAPVNILSRDRSWVVVALGDGALACPCTRARNIEEPKVALVIEQEAVIHVASVDVISRDRSGVVGAFREGALACACARTRNIDRTDGAVGSAQEAVIHKVYVAVNSFDLPVRSEASGECAVAVARGHVSARGIERRDGAVGSAQKAVEDQVRVCVTPRDRARLVDAEWEGKYGARRVELGDRAARIAHETVKHIA